MTHDFEDEEVTLTPEQRKRAEAISEMAHAAYSTPRINDTLPLGHLSHTQVDMYLRCARQYEFRYVKGEMQPPGVALTLGKGTHHALELTHHYIIDHDTPAPTENVLSAFSDYFDDQSDEIPEEVWQDEKADKGTVKDAGIRLVRLYNNKVAPNVKPQVKDVNGVQVRGIEKKIEAFVGGVKMLGYIDLIDTNDPIGVSDTDKQVLEKAGQSIPEALRTVIADFKTKAKAMPQSEVDGSMQLTLYSYVEGVSTVRFDQLLNQKVPKVKRIHSGRSVADHIWMKEIVVNVAKAISAGIFPPCAPTSWVCSERWCGFWTKCRGKKH